MTGRAIPEFWAMKILLCAATEMEIAPTLQYLSKGSGNEVGILVTGVGLMATTYALTKSVTMRRPEIIIQAGVAGCLDASLSLATVVAVKSEAVGDSGVMEGGSFRTPFDLKLVGSDRHPWSGAKLLNSAPFLQTINLPQVDAVTVNEISTAEDRINYYRNRLGAQVESMEGAALHYVGLQEEISFLQIRSLSNFIGERDKTKWQMKMAVENLNRELQHILQTITA